MKKVFVSLIVIGFVGINSMFGEESGYFAGVQFERGSAELNHKYCEIRDDYNSPPYSVLKREYCSTEQYNFKNNKYGFLAGYKQFFTPQFGLRYYAVFNVGKYEYSGYGYKIKEPNPPHMGFLRTKFIHKIKEQHLSINVDVLYNFITNELLDFGVFGGVSLAYVIYKYDMNKDLNEKYMAEEYMQIDAMKDFDMGLNLGLRANFIKRHSIELYSRFALMKQRETYAVVVKPAHSYDYRAEEHYESVTLTNKPHTSFGIRYVFSF